MGATGKQPSECSVNTNSREVRWEFKTGASKDHWVGWLGELDLSGKTMTSRQQNRGVTIEEKA